MDRSFSAVENFMSALGAALEQLIEIIVEAVRRIIDFFADAEMLREGVVQDTPFARQWGYRRRGWFSWRYGAL
jgi:hypothetical protein